MPELPEVEVARRQVESWWLGHTMDEVVVPDDKVLVHGDVGDLVGERVDEVFRRGKFLCVRAGARVLVLHFKMTGKVVRADGRKARITFSCGGDVFAFVDTRRLGKAWVVGDEELADSDVVGVLARLGPEPWPVALTAGQLRRRLGETRRAIKVALLDQEVIAGVGNIVAAEALWRAGIDPRTPAVELDEERLTALGAALAETCAYVLDVEDGDEIAYLNDPGGPEAENPFAVYQGETCQVCQGAIDRLTQAGRTTYWCPTCQTR